MSRHTQGPWYTAETGNHQGLIISETTGENVAVAYTEDDAPLIAAAPELLEVVEGLHDALSRMIDKYNPDTIEAEWLAHAHEVMCKARGDK